MTRTELTIQFDANGLVPAVIQDVASNDVLMVGFMNKEALDATIQTSKVHFWSRGRNKLWRKGETSGHEQIVDEIFINCEQNSLLVKVNQIGAVCHEGYSSCYFRRLEPDGSLTIVRERVFDPNDVYGIRDDTLRTQSQLWYGAYEYLRDNDLSLVSGTSRLLRSGVDSISHRIGDELSELAGVLDGTHGHSGRAHDVVLEGSQVLYWVAVNSVSRGHSWDELRPDRALATEEPDLKIDSCARLLHAEAENWTTGPNVPTPTSQSLHAVIALVTQACRSAEVEPIDLIRVDLVELRARSYLARYFAKHQP